MRLILSCSRLVNALIRRDTQNQWLLRINLEQRHKQVIKDASVLSFNHCCGSALIPTDTSPNTFTEAMGPKLIQESIYLNYMQGFLKDRAVEDRADV
jgi:hypothetical protein